jgi:pyruvate formate lyase activating enzyme
MNMSTAETSRALETGILPTRYWHRLDDGRVVCDLCPRACKLHEGQRGLCFVRACENGEIVLTTYGRSSGYCVDPIEKKPLNHFLPGTPVLSFGTAGCNLACKFCQNWDISKSREIDTLADSAAPETIARVAHDLDCRSVAYTYNDPVIFMEYAIDSAIACHERGIRTVAVTAGYICDEPRREFFSHIDAANVDLKAFT